MASQSATGCTTAIRDWRRWSTKRAEDFTRILKHLNDNDFFMKLLSVKQANKQAFPSYATSSSKSSWTRQRSCSISSEEDPRVQEATLNILNVIHRYLKLSDESDEEKAPGISRIAKEALKSVIRLERSRGKHKKGIVLTAKG